MFDFQTDTGEPVLTPGKVMLAVGRTDMRLGIQGLASVIEYDYKLEPREPGTLWLFCGRNHSVIKGLIYRETGFELITKRLNYGHYEWPQGEKRMMELDRTKFRMLMDGFPVISSIRKPDAADGQTGGAG